VRPLRVLLIEDHPEHARRIRSALQGPAGRPAMVVEATECLSSALEVLAQGAIDVVLAGLDLPDSRGLDTFRRLHRACAVPIVIVAGHADDELALRLVREGAQDCIDATALDGPALARRLTYACERHRLRLESEARVALAEVIGARSSLAETARRVARELSRTVSADAAGVFLRDASGPGLRPIAGYRVPSHMRDGAEDLQLVVDHHGALLEAWESHRTVWSIDAAHDARIDPGLRERFPHRSLLFAPLVTGGAPIGALAAVWWHETKEPRPGEERLVDALARQAAGALDTAAQLEQSERRRRRMEEITRVTRALAEAVAPRDVGTCVVDGVRSLFDGGTAVLRLLEPDGALRTLAVAGPVVEPLDLGSRLRSGAGAVGRAGADGRPAWCEDVSRDATLPADLREEIHASGRRAVLAAPMRVDRRVIGALSIGIGTARPFCSEEIALLETLAHSAALSLDRALLHEETEQRRRAAETSEHALQESEAQLRQLQKMEAVGLLAGGIAHDFNNLLTVVSGRAQFLLARLRPEDPLRRHVALIEKTTERAAALTRQLLAFSRKQVLRPTVLDLNAVVEGMTAMLQRLIGEDIELTVSPAPGLARLKADASQLEQVIVNLAVNARDAMPEGGRLAIATANVDGGGPAHQVPDVRPGPYVMLTVGDSGSGIPPDVLPRIFEPFFTTKDRGRGTGLGLSTVYGIVKQSGGAVTVTSEPGCGTTFRVYLPAVADLRPAEVSDTAAAFPGGSEVVLLAEDDAAVRDLARECLESQGYAVLPSARPSEAVAWAARHPGAIHLLLTDVVMPEMSGSELARLLRDQRPDLRVLFMSGYTEDQIARHGVTASCQGFLPKPFSQAALARRVRAVLDA